MSAATGGKYFRPLRKKLEALGYECTGESNANSQWIFTHPDRPDLPVNPNIGDGKARQLVRTLGIADRRAKRSATAAKERQARERERLQTEQQRLADERERILRERDALLDGAAAHLSNAEIAALERRVAEIEREQRELQALMTDIPTPSSHRGKGGVSHRSGTR